MVKRKLEKDTVIDLWLLYTSPHHDFTIRDLAERVGMSRNRLGELFKRINPNELSFDYGATNLEVYIPIYKEWQEGKSSIGVLATKYLIPKSTLHRKFQELNNEKD